MPTETRKIYCCGCKQEVDARLTNGCEIYPHREDLQALPFWKCDSCKNHVGCHHKTKNRTRPLGNIPTKEIRGARQHIHAILDPLYKSGRWNRGKLYATISSELGYEYHTAEITTLEEARKVYAIVQRIAG